MYKQLQTGVSAGMCVSAVAQVLQEQFVSAPPGSAVWRPGGTGLGSLASSPLGEGSFTLNLEVSYGIASTRDGASLASSSSV